MTNFTETLRKNIGMIISIIGLVLLVILTFGDMGELFTKKYWENVGGNITSIGALTVGLVMVQVSIKQGVSEQALSKGLNTKETKEKYTEHRTLIEVCQEKSIYLPHFLRLRNIKETKRRKQEFLIDNNFTSEKMLRLSKKKRLIKAYEKIKTNISVDDIKWSTTNIKYNKNGSIEKLDKFRIKRFWKGLLMAFAMMIGTVFITGGLFLDVTDIPFWQKFVKLITYLITMGISVIFDISKNYEKGAFGVPNELDEVNNIWKEFQDWNIPEWVKEAVSKSENETIEEIQLNDDKKEKECDETKDTINDRAVIQEKPI